jgi:hypothetical protein
MAIAGTTIVFYHLYGLYRIWIPSPWPWTHWLTLLLTEEPRLKQKMLVARARIKAVLDGVGVPLLHLQEEGWCYVAHAGGLPSI